MRMIKRIWDGKCSLQFVLSGVFAALIAFVGASLTTLAYFEAVRIIDQSTDELLARISEAARDRTQSLFTPAESAAEILAKLPMLGEGELARQSLALEAMISALEQSPDITAVYSGNSDGEFLLVRRVPEEAAALTRFNPPEGTRYIIQSLERKQREAPEGRFVYLAQDLTELGAEARSDYANYEPRIRPWYKAAIAADGVVNTAPYVYFSTYELGTTVARQSADGKFVIGVDITLAALGTFMAGNRVTEGSNSVLVTSDGLIVAHPNPDSTVKVFKVDGQTKVERLSIWELNDPVLAEAFEAYQKQGNSRATVHHGGQDWVTAGERVSVRGAEDYILLSTIPKHELLTGARALVRDAILISLSVLCVSILVVLFVARLVTKPLRQLRRKAEAVRRFDFHNKIHVATLISDVDDLARATDMMEATVRRFLEITNAISGEKDFEHLVVRLLDEIIAATRTKAGVLYLTSDDDERLVPHTGRLDLRRPLDHDMPDIPFAKSESLVVRSIADKFALDAPASEAELEALGFSGIAAAMDEPPRNLLAAPLFNRSEELVGVLLLMETSEMDPALVRFTEALSGSAAVSVETRQLIEAQKNLFESLIKLIAGAIDAKSPYTGGHCERVPELTKMLASAAHEATEGPLKDFTVSDDEREAIHVAAWLHDCGKVTTPEYIVDKATKLETIYDRIHELRMRIEVMKREREIAFLKEVIANGESSEERHKLHHDLKQLDEDFAFLAKCNIGGELMSDEDIARVRSLATKTWTRTLDDRAGVSPDELKRKERTAVSALPVSEPLLADKEEHLFERSNADRIPQDNPWGFDMAVPELLYNRGEIHNLCVRRGTLTEEDRYKINEHIVQTIKMLEQLDFPKHLQDVPELAGGHHERMDGKGYPKRLKGDQMSLVARMMAIADIFEALTAADRPYKKGKALSEALRIMHYMARDGHIDPDLFNFFLMSGVYRDYAARFMRPQQVDPIDPLAYRLETA